MALARLESVDLGVALNELGLGEGAFLFFGWYSLINPWLEELYWRGLLLDEQRRPAVIDLLFGGYHALVLVLFVDWPWAVLGFLVLSATAWLWRRLVLRFDGLLVPVVTHMAADISIIFVVYVLIRGV